MRQIKPKVLVQSAIRRSGVLAGRRRIPGRYRPRSAVLLRSGKVIFISGPLVERLIRIRVPTYFSAVILVGIFQGR